MRLRRQNHVQNDTHTHTDSIAHERRATRARVFDSGALRALPPHHMGTLRVLPFVRSKCGTRRRWRRQAGHVAQAGQVARAPPLGSKLALGLRHRLHHLVVHSPLTVDSHALALLLGQARYAGGRTARYAGGRPATREDDVRTTSTCYARENQVPSEVVIFETQQSCVLC